MKNSILLILAAFFIYSCDQEVNKTAGEWVSTGETYEIGSNENVEIVKNMISAFNNMDTDAMQELMADTLVFYGFSQKDPTYLPREATPQWMAQYDSVESRAVYFLPYRLIGEERPDVNAVQTGQLENLYWKDGRVDSLRILNKFFIDSDGKIRAIRQWGAEW